MTPLLRGFAGELVKLADENKDLLREAKQEAKELPKDTEAIRMLRGGSPVSRNYLSSTLIGAAAAPAMAIAGKSITRALHNRGVRKAIREAPIGSARRALLRGELQTGPLVGRMRPDLPISKRPALTAGELASDAAKGGLMGSIVQMIRDRYSGEGEKKKP